MKLDRFPNIKRILAANDYAQAPKLNMKEAVDDFIRPDLDGARLYIRKTRALGLDGYDLKISVPVQAEWLKKKKYELGPLVQMVHQWIKARTGLHFGVPSTSTVDLKRQRAKGGMKTVEFNWMIDDPIMAYALGVDLTEFSGSFEVPETKEEIVKRFDLAEKTAQEAKKLREEVSKGQKTQEDWKAFLDKAKEQGMNYRITRG